MEKTRIIKKHSKTCFMIGKTINPWSGISNKSFYGNYVGNRNAKRGNHHLWYEVMCNDPSCDAIKIVHSSVLKYA